MKNKLRWIALGFGALLACALPLVKASGWSYTETAGSYGTTVTVPACECQQVLVVTGNSGNPNAGAGANHGPLAFWNFSSPYSNSVSGDVDAGDYTVYMSILGPPQGGGQSTIVFSW